MAGTVSKDDVLYIAKLARLEYSDAEAERFTGEMNAILDYIKKLDELDTSAVEPTSHVLDIANVMREDVAVSALTNEQALKNAPESAHGHFQVPRVIE